jgi:diguanylate cyclase (GGDEF)-like protein
MDQFKHINDSCGHLAGDELLRNVASLLSIDLHHADILARVGGDEFCLVLAGRNISAVSTHLQQLLSRIAAFRFSWDQQIFTIGASIGVVALGGEQGSLTDLLKAADSGCYLAKNQGRNRYFIVDADGPELNHLQQQRQLLSLLHTALDEHRFELYAQPIVSLSVPPQGLHLEALLRLRDTDGAMVSPALFIPLAEQQGLMGLIDRWVIRRVLQQLAATPAQLPMLDKIAINLSGPSLSDPDLLPFIQQQLQLFAIPAAKICFEITETAAITNMAAANRFIDSLRQIGCKFALDDFGVGMSSFAYLKHLPVDYLKIDGSFVKAMTQNATDAVMVRAMADIARSMQIQTIAEFVPDEATCVLLRSIGVHYGQGYGLGHPAPWQTFFPQTGTL